MVDPALDAGAATAPASSTAWPCAATTASTPARSCPGHVRRFRHPYLAQLTADYRELVYYVIKHTDGNIMPILDRLVCPRPAAPCTAWNHRVDVDLAEVVNRRVGARRPVRAT